MTMTMSQSMQQAAIARPASLGKRQVLVAFSGLLLGMLLGALDQTVLATALPTIVDDLGGVSMLSWVVTAYLLTSTVSIPLWGKLGDLYGRKRLFQAALVVFLTGSALCGTAGSIGQLVAFRALQGLGAGGLFTLAMAIIGDLVAPRERGRYQGATQATFALASIAGPLIGGAIVDHLDWRWVFYVNLPIGFLALLVTGLTLFAPGPRRQRRIHVDYAGAALLVATVTCLLLTLALAGNVYAWTSPFSLALVVAAPLLCTAFIVREKRASEPVLPLTLLRDPVLAISSATLFLSTCAFFGAIVFLPIFLQLVRGDTGTSSGLLLLPMMLGTTISATASGTLVSWSGRYKIFPVVGLALMTIALCMFAQMGPATEPLDAALLMLLFGSGFGMVGEVMIVAVQNGVQQRDLGTATGAANLFRALGGSVGVAIYGSIFTSQLRFWTERADTAQATANALSPVFLAAALMATAAFIVVLFLEQRPLRSQLRKEED
jgi:EmrB/QacA subfamily drug resistance transporter